MSYDVSILSRPPSSFRAQPVKLDRKHDFRGGVTVAGGTGEATINITYNYAAIFERVLKYPIACYLEGRAVRETLPELLCAVLQMSGQPENDYYKASEGNARAALVELIYMALATPETTGGYWHVE